MIEGDELNVCSLLRTPLEEKPAAVSSSRLRRTWKMFEQTCLNKAQKSSRSSYFSFIASFMKIHELEWGWCNLIWTIRNQWFMRDYFGNYDKLLWIIKFHHPINYRKNIWMVINEPLSIPPHLDQQVLEVWKRRRQLNDLLDFDGF